ncbi:MAG: GHKL domain-containing protein [Clostridia bacterium]|nr:GHKL domain-containing protein [Clostridia bacterium]
MKRNIFLRIFALVATLVVLMFAIGISCMHNVGKSMTRERLVAECELILSVLKDWDDIENLESYYRKNSYRITVVNKQGDVLYDSAPDKEIGEYENHLNREEIKGALEGKEVVVERNSDTFSSKMSYYAKKTTLEDGTDIVLRLAIRTNEVGQYVSATMPFLVISLVLAIVFSIWYARKISGDVSEKVTQVGNSLKSLNDGEYQPIKVDSREPELFSVYTEINQLNSYVHRKIINEERESRKLSEVLDNVSQGIIALNQINEIVFVNNSALTIFNGNGEYTGRKLFQLIESRDLESKINTPAGEIYNFEYLLEQRILAVSVKHVQEPTLRGIVSKIVVITDITNERSIVKQKSDFFANASHELKTPITVMQGLTELLLSKETIDDGSKKQIERIHKESIRMASLIADMLKLSRLEKSENDTDEIAVPIDLRNVVDEVVSELTNQIAQKNITTKVEGSGRIVADPKKIYELVTNLCTNAVNYNKEDGSIEISIESTEKQTLLQVKDTGIGIAKEHIPRLCERFYRVDKSRSKKTGGTGLGLAIVKHICAYYSAELSIESDVGVGTTVVVAFPIAK